MKDAYDIYLDNNVIGTATVQKEGLYWHICCRCQLPQGEIYKIAVETECGDRDIGICVPVDGCFCLNRKIPVKQIGERLISVCALPKNASSSHHMIPIDPKMPFQYLNQLRNASLKIQNGQLFAVITDRSANQ